MDEDLLLVCLLPAVFILGWIFSRLIGPYKIRSRFLEAPAQYLAPSLPPGVVIEYATDVEGNWEYWNNFVANSTILSRGKDGLLELDDNGVFVFGGDAVDKGCGDIRFVKDLLHLKARYKNRVIIILGNRDINKLRFERELSEEMRGKQIDVFWDPKAKSFDAFCSEKGLDKNDLVSTLKWMLACTMGSATTFEQRRTELAQLKRSDVSSVTDQDVFDSFRNSVLPDSDDPWMLELIKVGQLAARIGDCLFVHGGIGPTHLGQVPGCDGKFNDLDDWIERLNDWKAFEFEKYPKERPEGLLKYALPESENNQTTICANFLKNGNCVEISDEVESYLVEAGIRRVFSGHQPHGDCPAVIRSNNLQVFTCDTSYSDMNAPKDQNPSNNRGNAVSVVSITNLGVKVFGYLADGKEHGYTLRNDGETALPDGLVGRRLNTHEWVKTVAKANDKPILLVKGEGFKLTPQFAGQDEVVAKLAEGHEVRTPPPKTGGLAKQDGAAPPPK